MSILSIILIVLAVDFIADSILLAVWTGDIFALPRAIKNRIFSSNNDID